MIYEVRDYHYRADLFDAYRAWAVDAVPVLRRHLDVVGFWVDEGTHAPIIKGSNPVASPHGTANVTWIIRWESRAVRDVEYPRAFRAKDWRELWARHPDPGGYLQQSVRFMTAMT